jgi:hypothetical protein
MRSVGGMFEKSSRKGITAQALTRRSKPENIYVAKTHMKQKHRQKRVEHRSSKRAKRSDLVHDQVRRMAAYGLVEDQIALRLNGMDKNRLRRKYIDSIKEGRAIASAARAEAEAAELTRKEKECLAAVKASFNSDWYSPEYGNDLFDGAHTVAEALAQCKNWQ